MRRYVYLFLVPLLSGPVAAQQPDSYTYQIVFTGRTLGYARVPDEQMLAGPTGEGSPNAMAQKFLGQFTDLAKNSAKGLVQLRIGMGDNFAPDFYARTFNTSGVVVPGCDGGAPYPASIHLPKDLFNYEDGHWPFWCNSDSHYFVGAPFYDNVAEFFAEAKYDAVVPGKHDFYFGAQYLREVGNFLRGKRVQMLAENLVMTTAIAPGVMNAHPRIPERFAKDCRDDTGKHECYHSDFGAALLELPDNVLPWKRQFVLQGARRAAIDAKGTASHTLLRFDELKGYKATAVKYEAVFDENRSSICVEPGPSTASDPSMVLVPSGRCMPVVPADAVCQLPLPAHLASTCKALFPDSGGVYDAQTNQVTTDVTFLFRNAGDHLAAGLNHMFCTYPAKGSTQFPDTSTRICQPFPVQVPLFWSVGDVDSAAPCPYALVKRDGGMVAVFGVVDADLLANVGMLNTSWLNGTRKWDTRTQVTAPDYALLQTLELCNASEACRTAPKVLLAQMSYARASQLIATNGFASAFDVVIAQASAEHDTGEAIHTFKGKSPRFVLSPPEPVGSADSVGAANGLDASGSKGQPVSYSTFTPQVYSATVSKTGSPVSWKLSNRVPAAPEKVRARPAGRVCEGYQSGCMNLERWSKEWLSTQKAEGSEQKFPVTAPGAASAFTQAVLFAMRKGAKADVAMIQSRDLYDADNLSYEAIARSQAQDQISRILWKDDFVVVLHVTGATIRKLLQQSAAFAQQDQSALSTEIEKGRDLITLGIYAHPKDSDTYYINGALLSDTALYTIAATDFVAGGDTGYSILATPDVPPAFRVEDFAHDEVRPIAGLVCQALLHPGPEARECVDMGLRPGYFDSSAQKPFDKTAGFSTGQHWYWRGFLKNFIEPRRPFFNTEEHTQQRAFWQLNLENLDFSESGVFINHIAKTTASLGGVSNPLLASKGNSNVGADHKARLVYDFRRGTFYGLSDSSFLSNDTTPGPPSLTNNVLGSEGGGTIRLPWRRSGAGLQSEPNKWERPSWLSAQYSVRYEHQLVTPVGTQIPLTSGATVTLPTPRINTIYGRAGLRAEMGDTYLETGFEEIDTRGLLQSYALTPAGGQTLSCQPSATGLLCGPDKTPINGESVLGAAGLAAMEQTTAYKTPGAYLNFNWKFPIWSRRDTNRTDQSWYFTLTNKGDLYFNTRSDTAVQTRYLDKLTPALSFPIWGNISLTPKVDFVLYENKINGYHYRAIQPSVSVSYTFIRREGMGWARALAYGAQTTTAFPAGSTH